MVPLPNIVYTHHCIHVRIHSTLMSNLTTHTTSGLQEDYIVKQVDLLSGFGGAVGLWLGWSALTLGHFLVQTVKTLNSVTIFK